MNKINPAILRPLLVSAALLFAAIARPQYENAAYCQTQDADSVKPKSFSVKFHANNFLKNNEFFGEFTEGITYIGSVWQPELSYHFTQKTTLTAGWYARYFFGEEKLDRSLPVIRFEYRFMPGATLIFGQLTGQLEHKLIEPIYSFDNYFTRNPENGVQLTLDRFGIKADIWLDWENFLKPGDAEQERFTSGINVNYSLLKKKRTGFSACLQAVAHHHGGQVDQSDLPLQTRVNIAPGAILSHSPGKKLVSDLKAAFWLVQSLDLSPTPTLPYKKGFGTYTNLFLENEWAAFMVAWWHGEYYFAPLGDYLFQSVSERNDWYKQNTRDLINMKIHLSHQVADGIKGGFQFETYHDIKENEINFLYGINIRIDAGRLRKNRH